jgi:hypothetical protein
MSLKAGRLGHSNSLVSDKNDNTVSFWEGIKSAFKWWSEPKDAHGVCIAESDFTAQREVVESCVPPVLASLRASAREQGAPCRQRASFQPYPRHPCLSSSSYPHAGWVATHHYELVVLRHGCPPSS